VACSSAIVHDVMQYCQSHGAFAIGYFYFDFSNPVKQQHVNLIRSLIVQFSARASRVPEALETLYSQNKNGQTQPSTDALIAVLKSILQAFDQSFIIMDALDECSDREELLSFINGVIDWKVGKLHILATSRKETDISEVLDPLITEQIPIQNDLVNADIRLYIQERLQNDTRLKKWPEKIRMEIETTLMNGAHGM
jgi:hypothetical protein